MTIYRYYIVYLCFFAQTEDGIRYLVRSRGLGDVYKRQAQSVVEFFGDKVNLRLIHDLEAAGLQLKLSESSIPKTLSAKLEGQTFVVSGVFSNFSREDLKMLIEQHRGCLLYTSDAADERSSVDLGGSRIIKKKNNAVK